MRRSLLVSILALASTGVGLAVVACSSDDPQRTVTAADGGSVTPIPTGTGTGTGNPPTTGPDGAVTTKKQADFVGDQAVQNGSKLSKDTTLTADTVWTMKGIVYVPAGVTLTIEKGTTLKGDKSTSGTLVIQTGGKIHAVGTADEPIVFTSQAKEGQRAAGDWGGVILLGKAPVNGGKTTSGGETVGYGYIEGLIITEENKYGGDRADDSSGVMQYVRIEYNGVKLGQDNEINGLTFGGVGAGTVIDHIMVRHALDDCFEFFGGTVSAHHLVCAYNQDDGFDWDNGYSGKLQFLVLQQDPKFDDEMNGFEADNDATGSAKTPISNPSISNATLCGQGQAGGAKRKFGMLLRRNTAATIRNVLVWGFDAALDVRDPATHARAQGTSSPALTVQGSQFFGFTLPSLVDGLMAPPPALADGGAGPESAFSEAAWIKDPANGNVWDQDPAFDCANPEAPSFVPKNVVTDEAATPPEGLDPSAKYVGAFKDASDTWATTGKWVAWTKPGF